MASVSRDPKFGNFDEKPPEVSSPHRRNSRSGETIGGDVFDRHWAVGLAVQRLAPHASFVMPSSTFANLRRAELRLALRARQLVTLDGLQRPYSGRSV